MATPGRPSRRSCSAAPEPLIDGSNGSTGKEWRPWPGTSLAAPFASVPHGWPSSSIWSVPKSRVAFVFLPSRGCCEVVALLMLRCYRLDVSRETIRRWLHKGGMVYRRPTPVVKPDEAERRGKRGGVG